jgi:predicted transcriptional regulator
MSRVLTLRLPDDDADKVEEVAEVKGLSVAEVMRQGVLQYVDQVRQQPEYGDQVLARVEQLRRQAEELVARGKKSKTPAGEAGG